MLLQEDAGTVSFDPTTIYRNPPWYEKLFVLYLLFMVLVLAARGLQLGLNLARLRKLRRESAAEPLQALTQAARRRAESLRRFAVLTFVLTFAYLCMGAADILTGISTEKVVGTHWLSLDAAEQFRVSAFGLLVTAALYAAGFLLQGRVEAARR